MMDGMLKTALITTLLHGSLVGSAELTATNPRVEDERPSGGCADASTTRNAYFGDLHIHTSYSHDAYAFAVPDDPGAAYVHARGYLDFAAVTDHAEFLVETTVCQVPGTDVYESEVCVALRDGMINRSQLESLCKIDPTLPAAFCANVLDTVWQRTRRAANTADTPCEFTAFIGYEYSLGAASIGASLHRNVIFRSATVPAAPVSSYDALTALDLWDSLDLTCLAEAGCQVLAIPHNPNRSEGEAFVLDAAEPARDAWLRARYEPLVEVFQHKGNSECYPFEDIDDPECAFEQLPIEQLTSDGMGEVPRTSFVREALKDGLRFKRSLGVNPFKFGLSGATDTHNAAAITTVEAGWQGHTGNADDEPLERVRNNRAFYNPGGLTGVWASENTRAEIFDAMLRKEVFATSGTRLTVRLFGGFDYAPTVCGDGNVVADGYAGGVPMGGDLSAAPGVAPKFIVLAQADPQSIGISELQIIKAYSIGNRIEEEVFSIASATEPEGNTFACQWWEDPQFDPTRQALYYARVMEAFTPRWSAMECSALEVDCTNPDQLPPNVANCCTVPLEIRERAWSSPIWYEP